MLFDCHKKIKLLFLLKMFLMNHQIHSFFPTFLSVGKIIDKFNIEYAVLLTNIEILDLNSNQMLNQNVSHRQKTLSINVKGIW